MLRSLEPGTPVGSDVIDACARPPPSPFTFPSPVEPEHPMNSVLEGSVLHICHITILSSQITHNHRTLRSSLTPRVVGADAA